MAILGPDGRPFRAAEGPGDFPRTHREPPLQITGRFTKKDDFKAVVQMHDMGQFQLSSWLASQMMTDSRVASAMGTRSDGLIGKKIVWAPGKLNPAGRRAARDIETDWPLIAPPTARAQMLRWGLISGVKAAQRHWYVSSSGRAIPKTEPYSTQFVSWDWATFAYRIWTWNQGIRIVPSPSLTVPGEAWAPMTNGTNLQADDPRQWVVFEPFGVHSWRDEQNLLHSLWEVYFGHALANNDMNRVCEKQGRGQMKLKYPRTSSGETESRDKLIAELLNVGAEGVFPLEQSSTGEMGEPRGYELEPFDWSSQGWEIVKGTKASNADEIAILILGHATMQQTSGASVGASASTGNLIRGDIAVGDTFKEASWAYPTLREWAEANYGDPDCAPIAGYVVDEPMANVAAAQTAQFLSVALPVLVHYGVDPVEALRRFNFPLVTNPPTNPGPPPVTTKPAVEEPPKP